jgi:hypothetical protein
MAKFNYLEIIVAIKIWLMRKLRGLDLASDCNNSAQKLFSSFLIPKNVNVKI